MPYSDHEFFKQNGHNKWIVFCTVKVMSDNDFLYFVENTHQTNFLLLWASCDRHYSPR